MGHHPDHCPKLPPALKSVKKKKKKKTKGDFRLLQGAGRWENLFLVKKKIFFQDTKFQKTFQGVYFNSPAEERECVLA